MKLILALLALAVVVFGAGAMPEPGDSVRVTTIIYDSDIFGELVGAYVGDLIEVTEDFTCLDCILEHVGENITVHDPPMNICLGNGYIYEIIYTNATENGSS